MVNRRLHPATILAILPIGFIGCQSAHVAPGVRVTNDALFIIPANVESRSITWENPTGEKGTGGQAASQLGPTRKGAPCITDIKNGQTVTLMDYQGCGIIRHIWLTLSPRSPQHLRNLILRMYWDGSTVPSVEVPLGDFFGTAHGRMVELSSAYMTCPRGRGFNCFFPMPFATGARITVENDLPDGKSLGALFYQIDFEKRDRLPAGSGRFHAQFRRQNPTILKSDYVVLDGVEGPGAFVGCVIGVRTLSGNWWGEGEMKFYLDGDGEFPTICGTGAEDYFCAAYGMGLYQTLYHGCTLNLENDFFQTPLVSMYRWHGPDPIYFNKDLKATIQQIGWGQGGLYERSDDYCSVAYWYQAKPISRIPPLPDRAARTANIIEPPKEK